MKASNDFKSVISAYLESRAISDPLFAKTLSKENKSIDECINYILSTVQKSGCNGFDDNEIYNMAVHYYDEDDIKNIKGINGKVVINHAITLTPAEVAKAKQDAVDKIYKEERERMTKKPKVDKPVITKTADKKAAEPIVAPGEQSSLF